MMALESGIYDIGLYGRQWYIAFKLIKEGKVKTGHISS